MNYKNSIIYISLSIIMSSIVYGIHLENVMAAIILAVIFFVISFLYLYINLDENITNFIVCISLFFIIGLINNYLYYNKYSFNYVFQGEENFREVVRITKKCNYSYIGECNGRNIYVTGKLKDIYLGEKIYINGKFTKNIDYEYGNIGEVKIYESSKIKDDFISSLYKLREELYNKIKENLGKRKASLISSLSYGYNDYLDEEDEEDMRNLGVIHAISVSGLHVALIYEIVKKILGKKASIIVTFIYVVFTGLAFSSLRAFIMIFLKVFAVDFRKKYNPLAALAFSSIVIIIYKPYAIFNLGFILSFCAILGIILFFNNINKKLYRVPGIFRDTVAMTIASGIFTIPVLICNFEKISMVSILGNLFVVPILTVIIKIGNLLILFINCSKIFDFLCYFLLNIINILDYIIETFSSFNSSYFINKELSIIYCCFLISFYFYKRGHKKIMCLALSSVIAFFISFYSPIMKLSYINEGAILISYKGNRRIICNSQNYKANESKKKNMASDVTRKCNRVKINNIIITSEGDNYLLYVADKKYFLKISNKTFQSDKYDIINFVNKRVSDVYILDEEILCIK